MNQSIIIIGAGQASVQAAISLRAGGFDGAITIFGEEAVLPYQRPPLSKAFLAGTLADARLHLRPETFYAQQRITLRLGQPVCAIDRKAHEILTAANERMSYDIALIATGGTPRRLSARGADLDNIFYLHDLEDSRHLRHAFTEAQRMVIIGGGYIGLEAAATARKHGLDVMVLEAADRILARVAAPEISDYFMKLHRQHGARIETGMHNVKFSGNKKISAVQCDGHDPFPADIALIGIGLMPETELASQAGLKVADGICVDAMMRTSDESIYAIGDCTHAPHPLYDVPMRLESVQNAIYQAKIAAAAICGQKPPPVEAPWFWSDQYDAKLQIAGIARSYDQTILRGRVEDHSFVLFYLSGGQLLAADCINRPQEFLLARRAIAQKDKITPSRLADDRLPPQEAFCQ